MSARTYECPSCGAQVEEQARRCRHCAAPVATVRCAACFHMNVPQAGYCSGCGGQLGLEPIGEAASLPCPICKQPLTAFRSAGERPESGTLFDCSLCGGQFVELTLLREMLHHHEHAALPEAAARLSGHPPRLPALADPRTHYVPCPVCGSLMNRKNFGEMSGVIVDVCRQHGTFFDAGELPRVLAFVAGGGLERSRRRAADEEARLHREARVAAATISHPTSSRDRSADYPPGAATLTELLINLLIG